MFLTWRLTLFICLFSYLFICLLIYLFIGSFIHLLFVGLFQTLKINVNIFELSPQNRFKNDINPKVTSINQN